MFQNQRTVYEDPEASSALVQLRRLSDEHPSYATLAQILSEPEFVQYDIALRTKVGRLRAHGGFADVYVGELQPFPVVGASGALSSIQRLLGLVLPIMPISNTNTAKKVAIKRFRIFLDGEKDFAKAIAKEIRAWLPLDHINILPFLGFTVVQEAPSLVSEWMENGNLRQYMSKEQPSMTRREKLALGIARGLAYLHEMRVVHGDVKSDNILICDKNEPKLADFGIARVAVESGATGSSTMTGHRGSARWTAIELWRAQMGVRGNGSSSDNHVHTKKADVWAFGMVVYELLSGKLPYYECPTEVQVMFAIVDGKLPEMPELVDVGSGEPDPGDIYILRALWCVCLDCWDRVPRERPTMERVVEDIKERRHAWIRQSPGIMLSPLHPLQNSSLPRIPYDPTGKNVMSQALHIVAPTRMSRVGDQALPPYFMHIPPGAVDDRSVLPMPNSRFPQAQSTQSTHLGSNTKMPAFAVNQEIQPSGLISSHLNVDRSTDDASTRTNLDDMQIPWLLDFASE